MVSEGMSSNVLLEMMPLVLGEKKKQTTQKTQKTTNQQPVCVFIMYFMLWSPCTGEKKNNKTPNVTITLVFC